MAASLLPQVLMTIGLACDIVGALLVANEVVRVFRGPTIIETGHPGALRGRSNPQPNPAFEQHETKKRYIMKWGLFFLVMGFLLQGIASWISILI
jgi:hypothetical protein